MDTNTEKDLELDTEFEIEIVDDEADNSESTPAGAQANDEKTSDTTEDTAEVDSEETELDGDDSDASGDPEGGTDDEPLNEDEKKKYGERAQKRIRRLVAERKALEEKLAALEERASKAEEQALSIESRANLAEERLLEAHELRIKAQRADLRNKLKEARELGDFDKEQEIAQLQSRVEHEASTIEQYKNTRARELEKRKTSNPAAAKEADTRPASEPAKNEGPKPSQEVLKWKNRNNWFGGTSQGDKIKTAAALAIHETLLEEGYDPRMDEQEYLAALDSRLQKEFPDLRKKPQTGAQKTAGAARGSATDGTKKNVVKLTKSDLSFCERNGIDPKKYAIEKMKLQRGS